MNLRPYHELSFLVNEVLKLSFQVVQHELINEIAFSQVDSNLSLGIGSVDRLTTRARTSHEVGFDMMLFDGNFPVRWELGCGCVELRNDQEFIDGSKECFEVEHGMRITKN